MTRLFFPALIVLGFLMMSHTAAAQERDLENTLYLDLKDGRVVIEMHADKAPKHVARIKELTRQGFYNGVKWHRVIEGFMAQTGDPTGTGAGGSGQKLKAEFNDVKHVAGTVSMARATHPDSADSQFFICFDKASNLDGQYTAWGKVVEGMDFVNNIKRGDAANNGKVENPDVVVKLQVAADAEKAKSGAAATPAKTEEKAAEKPAEAPAAAEKAAEPAAAEKTEEKAAEKPAEAPAAAEPATAPAKVEEKAAEKKPALPAPKSMEKKEVAPAKAQ